MNTITIPAETSEKIEADIASITNHVSTLKIETKDQYKAGAELLAKLKTRKDRVKALEKELLGEIVESVKKAKNKFKMLAQPYVDAEATVRSLLNDYIRKEQQEAERQAAELRKKQEEARKENPEAKQEMLAVPEPDMKVQTEAGGISTRTIKKWKVVAKGKIPRKYFILDEKAINAMMRTGEVIEGIEYYEEKVVAVRT